MVYIWSFILAIGECKRNTWKDLIGYNTLSCIHENYVPNEQEHVSSWKILRKKQRTENLLRKSLWNPRGKRKQWQNPKIWIEVGQERTSACSQKEECTYISREEKKTCSKHSSERTRDTKRTNSMRDSLLRYRRQVWRLVGGEGLVTVHKWTGWS